ERPPTRLWAVSAHNARDIQHAAAVGADVVLVSPVLPSPSHPADEPLGWEGLKELVAASPLPVYAQGGLGPGDIGAARSAGALGVAVNVSRLFGSSANGDSS
ncbi:MAG TPA: thiamine phosphate synthase, partial [Acidimicrobiales bacterium]